MIDLLKAKEAFKKYVSQFDMENERISLKISHTMRVFNISKKIATRLELEEEQIKLAQLIGLLHDIGRFKQEEQYHTYVDRKSMDHAEYGANLLKKDNFIREFIEDSKYDTTILKAVSNHNKDQIEENLSKEDELQAKIIRDADKIDNLDLKSFEKIEVLFDKKEINTQKISNEVYQDFLAHRSILLSKKKTDMDSWLSYIAFIFDVNFLPSFQIIKENKYIDRLVDRIDYQDLETREKMKQIRQIANQYVEDKILNKSCEND